MLTGREPEVEHGTTGSLRRAKTRQYNGARIANRHSVARDMHPQGTGRERFSLLGAVVEP
jgi:hypothetical protein